MWLNTGANSFDASFSILAGTRSGPEAFAGFRLLSSFFMPGAVNSMSGIGEIGSPSMLGRCPSGSLVNCEVYSEFRASQRGRCTNVRVVSGLPGAIYSVSRLRRQ